MGVLTTLRNRLAGRVDSEHEQALLRIVIVGLFLGYMALFHGSPSEWRSRDLEIVLILSGFFALAVAIFVAICIFPANNVPRRLIGMLADSGGATWYVCVAGDYAFFVIGVYLFITFGNGFRYGRRYLFGCQVLCLAGLSAALGFAPYWQDRRIAGIGLLIALVVLPLYVSTLLKRIQEARARAEEANTAKSTFLANMSHEMRTPLNGVVGVVDLFRTTELSPQQAELVQLLRHSVTVLRSLIDDVLDISKIEAGRLSLEVVSFDLHVTINALIQLLRPHAQSKGLAIHATVDPELDYKLRGDSHHLRQILLNLLGNAIKFTERGEVLLSVAMTRHSSEGVTARFEVRDTGIGISEELVPRIFERFVQADQSMTRQFGGSGLGTTIAKQLVELMGGTIGVISRLGEGSTFWFELPLLHDIASNRASIPIRADSNSNQRTVLIADVFAVETSSALLAAAGEAIEVFKPSVSIGSAFDALLAEGKTIRAVVASCAIDVACAAFASVRQRTGDKPIALIFIPNGPVSVVDAARIKSIREACILEADATPRLVANAIHAAIANSGREDADAVDLTQLLYRDRRQLTILVADDNITNQTIISRLLTSAGHKVVLARDGEEALDLYEHQHLDLAILDFNMPHRTGIEVIQAIRVMEPIGQRMPAIVLSASVTVEAREKSEAAGADAFVGKPFEASALIQQIDNLAEKLPHKALPRPQTTTYANARRELRNVPISAQADVVDIARLAELEDIARDTQFMTQLLRGFNSDVVSILGRMDRALESRQPAALDDLIHTLKGAAVGIGARELALLCDQPSKTDIRDPAKAARIVRTLRHSFEATALRLSEYARLQHQVTL